MADAPNLEVAKHKTLTAEHSQPRRIANDPKPDRISPLPGISFSGADYKIDTSKHRFFATWTSSRFGYHTFETGCVRLKIQISTNLRQARTNFRFAAYFDQCLDAAK